MCVCVSRSRVRKPLSRARILIRLVRFGYENRDRIVNFERNQWKLVEELIT
jgi:hypothetical protein